jgi:hypothetical protein
MRTYLLGLIEAEPDITIAEMQERLRREAGVSASVGTIWTFLDRAGLTFKNVWPALSASGFLRGDLTGLRQRIRSRGQAPAKMEFRTPWSS